MIGVDAIQAITNKTLATKGHVAIEFGEDECADLEFGGVPITLMYSTDPVEMVWLFVDLGRVQDDPRSLGGLLRYGFKLWAAGEMTVALDHDGEHLVGYSAAPASALTPETLENQLDRLMAGAADILDRLAHDDFELDLTSADIARGPTPMDWLAGRA